MVGIKKKSIRVPQDTIRLRDASVTPEMMHEVLVDLNRIDPSWAVLTPEKIRQIEKDCEHETVTVKELRTYLNFHHQSVHFRHFKRKDNDAIQNLHNRIAILNSMEITWMQVSGFRSGEAKKIALYLQLDGFWPDLKAYLGELVERKIEALRIEQELPSHEDE